MRKILLLILLFGCAVGCKKLDEKALETSNAISAIKLPAKAKVEEVKPEIEAKVIKTARLRFETADLSKTYQGILNKVKANKGIIQNDEEGKDYKNLYHYLTVRVPSENLDAFVASLVDGVGFFDEKTITAEDVTAQFIDVEARLNAKLKLEKRYLELLSQAKNVTQMLEIEKELSKIREDVEAQAGQLKYLQNQVAMSTVTIEFYKTIAENEQVAESYGSKLWTAIRSGFFNFSGFIVGLVSIWPFLILIGSTVYFIRKKIKRKKINS